MYGSRARRDIGGAMRTRGCKADNSDREKRLAAAIVQSHDQAFASPPFVSMRWSGQSSRAYRGTSRRYRDIQATGICFDVPQCGRMYDRPLPKIAKCRSPHRHRECTNGKRLLLGVCLAGHDISRKPQKRTRFLAPIGTARNDLSQFLPLSKSNYQDETAK